MKTIKTGLTAILLATAVYAGGTSEGISIDFLGTNNTLVRVKSQGRYLLMPVQESNDDAAVNVLVDGKLEKTIYVRLAKSKTDYSVPLDLEPYKGHNVVLNIITSQNRGSVREAKEDVCWDDFQVSDTFDTSNREKYRPAFHHTPLYGWMNDPNGMFYKNGRWHLYYQHNPYGSKWQNITWGHSSSADLVNWEHHPLAIEANGLGAVFSGSSVIDKDNTAGFGHNAVVALYTSAGHSQIQSLASSNDEGKTFHIYPANPVITQETEARDPNMFWNEATGEWNLLLAHALDHEMLVYSSPNLKDWTLKSSFGKGLGAQGGVWECPDLFQLPVKGSTQKKWMLICNINPGGLFGGSATQYFIGDFDGTSFIPDKDASGNVPTKWMDFGKDHYAAVTWSDAPDNRRTTIGWMSNWQYAAEVPTMQFRSANTLPREVGLFKASDGQIYASITPSPELEKLRKEMFRHKRSFKAAAKPSEFSLPADGLCEITADISAANTDSVRLTLSNGIGEKVVMTFNPSASLFTMDRTASGITGFSRDFPAITAAPVIDAGGKLSLRLFIDRSSIEAFESDGKFAMTNLVFPTAPYTTLSISSAGGNAEIHNLKIYSLKTTD